MAMFANMASSLIKHKRIKTTTAKAKALRTFVEPLITKSKSDSTHSRRVVFSYLKDKEAVSELFREISPKIADRPGGYTRILKTGNRLGDNAEMCIVELVDYNENMLSVQTETKAKSIRKRRGSKKKKGEIDRTDTTEITATEPVDTEGTEPTEEISPPTVVDEASAEPAPVDVESEEVGAETETEPREDEVQDMKDETDENIAEPKGQVVQEDIVVKPSEDQVKEEPDMQVEGAVEGESQAHAGDTATEEHEEENKKKDDKTEKGKEDNKELE